MKSIVTIIVFLFSFVAVQAQTKLDSLVLVKINQYRDSIGLSQLKFQPLVYKSADLQVQHLDTLNVVGHNNPQGFAGQRLTKLGFNSGRTGEIVAYIGGRNYRQSDTLIFDKIATHLVRLWLNSPGHKAIIETAEWFYFGASCTYHIRPSGFRGIDNYEVRSVVVFAK